MISGIDSYEGVKDELKFLTTSGVRIKLLISLNKENMNMDQFRDEFGYRTSTILPVLAELKSKDMIYKDDRQYGITPYGKLISSKLIDFVETLHMFKTQEQFWKNHETHVIPDLFFRNIGSLGRSTIVEDMPADLFATHRHFTELLGECEVVNGVSPFIHPDFPDLFKVFVESGAAVRLVVTYPVLKLLSDRHKDVLQRVVNMPNFSLRVIDEDVRVAFTVTEKLLSIGFFRPDGTYDYGMDLVSEDAAAIGWGNALFEYYWNRSADITEQDCTQLQ
ncbi:MAG: transcriptional regulator FilR1 domain-containing protein [Euryarchaeota archaeon]|nr:transcriptional regulator FilR1 domain-containing protein [Euryarchaeota archaeon]